MSLRHFMMRRLKDALHFNKKYISKCAGTDDYEGAIQALNTLQSNAEYQRTRSYLNLTHKELYTATILEVQKYLSRGGIALEELDKLSVIHVTGTKGKGSTCAYCESILRHHGYRTGFYCSPHLIEVRERIRINGIPVSRKMFASHFWKLYTLLQKQKSDEYDIPLYFRFLTIMAFQIFLEEKVDVAIIEVGIGGEYDCTNIIRKTAIVGITPLGLDHMNLLGNSIQSIAWNKSGILKETCMAFTVPQNPEAMKILQTRSIERKCTLTVVSSNFATMENFMKIPDEIFYTNFNLAYALANGWVAKCGKTKLHNGTLSNDIVNLAINNCVWPGRYQIIKSDNISYYLDGAHTVESMRTCASWYKQNVISSGHKKVLLFNTTGNRSSEQLLTELLDCAFDIVLFVPNVAYAETSSDDVAINENYQLNRCSKLKNEWLSLQHAKRLTSETVDVFPAVHDAIQSLAQYKLEFDVLITGSLHLVGSALSLLDQDLSLNNKLPAELRCEAK